MLRRSIPIALLFLIGCNSSEDDDTSDPSSWSAVFQDVDGGLLRVWGASANDVYLVGADADGTGPVVRHFDGTKWKSLAPPVEGDLWWVQGVGPDDVRMVGENGLALKYTPSTNTFEVRDTPTALTLFGVWGASSSDVWYVGGDTGRNRGVILRDDGDRVVEVSHTSTSAAAFFKAYGFGPNAVWMVGQKGTALFWDGTELRATDTGTTLPLMGVHGTAADRVWAVGGVANGVILGWNGSSWEEQTPASTGQLFGVWAAADTTYACGFNGLILERKDGVWAPVPKIPTYQDLHAIWVDETKAIWSVGGRLAESPPSGGVLVRYGSPISSEVTE